MNKKEINLPTTEEALKKLAEDVHSEFEFTDFETTLLTVCSAIQHLPREQGHTTMAYLAGCVRRALAYNTAVKLGRSLSGKIQVREVARLIETDPGDMQAADEMRNLANQGVPEAIAYLKEMEKQNETRPN